MNWGRERSTGIQFSNDLEKVLSEHPQQSLLTETFCILITYKNKDEFAFYYENEIVAKTIFEDINSKIVEGLRAKTYSNDNGSILVIFGNINFAVMFEVEE